MSQKIPKKAKIKIAALCGAGALVIYLAWSKKLKEENKTPGEKLKEIFTPKDTPVSGLRYL
jgi:hypothetical protein